MTFGLIRLLYHFPFARIAMGRRSATVAKGMVYMRKKTLAFIVAALLLLGLLVAVRLPSAHAAPVPVTTGLHAVGNQLVDSSTNTAVLLHGVNRSGTEYACIQGWGIFDGPNDAASVQAIASWGANLVRIPLNEDCWLGINGVAPAYSGANYQTAVENYVTLLHQNGMRAELSLIWGAPGSYQATYQSGAPDEDHSPAMWASLAQAFAGDTEDILAPWGETITGWTCFMLTGCSDQATYGPQNQGYQTASMQQAVNVMRGAGYTGLISIPCIDYANECANYNGSSWLQTHPTDTMSPPQLIAEAHEYGNNACGVTTGTSCLDAQDGPLAASVPFLFGEIGDTYDGSVCNGNYTNTILNWADAHQTSWAAWTWDTWGDCSSLSLISNYDGTVESGGYGQVVKTHMLSYGGSTPPPPTPTPTQPPNPTPTPTQPPTPTPTPTPTPPPSGGAAVMMGFAIGWQMPTTPPWGDINQEALFALQTTNGTALDTHFLSNVNVPAFVAAAHSHNVKALITIGGSSDQNWQNACVGANRAGFISNLVNYMQTNGFDGIDLDIEDDAWMASGPPDADMTNCIEAISTAAKAVTTQAGNTPIISGDVITNWAGPWWTPSQAYVDQYNLMTYGDTTGGSYQADVQATISQGLPKSKMVGGIDVIDAPSTNNQCGPFMQYAQQNGLLGAFVWDESTDEANGYPCFNQFAAYMGGGSPPPPPPPPPAPGVSLSVNSMNFGSVTQGTSSSQQTVILTNTGNATLNLSGIAIAGTNAADFTKTTNCGATVVAGAQCSVNVAFTPATTSAESATLSFADDAAQSPQNVALSGTGVALTPPPPPPPPPPSGLIFQDGFESGATSAWSDTNLSAGNTVNVSTQAKYTGAFGLAVYKAKGSGGDANLDKDFSKVPTADVRARFYLTNMVGSGEVNVLSFYSQDGYFLGWVELVYSNGGKSMTMYMYTGNYVAYACSAAPSVNAWHTIELQETAKSTTTGAMAVWLDGTQVCSKSNIKTDRQTYSQVACVRVGSDTSDRNTGFVMYVDDVEVATSYIGG